MRDNRSVPHVRSISDALAEIKAEDPETRLTLYGIRRAIKKGELPTCGSGRNYLVDVGVLKDYMRGKL